MSLDYLSDNELAARYIELSAGVDTLSTLPLYSSLDDLLAALDSPSE